MCPLTALGTGSLRSRWVSAAWAASEASLLGWQMVSPEVTSPHECPVHALPPSPAGVGVQARPGWQSPPWVTAPAQSSSGSRGRGGSSLGCLELLHLLLPPNKAGISQQAVSAPPPPPPRDRLQATPASPPESRVVKCGGSRGGERGTPTGGALTRCEAATATAVSKRAEDGRCRRGWGTPAPRRPGWRPPQRGRRSPSSRGLSLGT